jgi:AcrR family transcriptional regulator
MARNKFPEVTVEKILNVSKRLFLVKGYDNTTIQDIVDGLGGLTKGAIYHHFKSKEEIILTLGEKMFFESNPFLEVKHNKELNGLQKIRKMLKINNSDEEVMDISLQAMPLLKNPRILAMSIESNKKVLVPLWLELLEEANRDGSIKTEYAKEIAEFLSLIDFWILPILYPATAEETKRKFFFVVEMLSKMGLPLISDDMLPMVEKSLSKISKTE